MSGDGPAPGRRPDSELSAHASLVRPSVCAVEALGGPQAASRPDGQPPTIGVATRHDPSSGVVRLSVSDNGPGVRPADRDKLFMPYYSTKGRGSGLGLAIVRRIVSEHGGAIEASDARPTGTTFTVELPAT